MGIQVGRHNLTTRRTVWATTACSKALIIGISVRRYWRRRGPRLHTALSISRYSRVASVQEEFNIRGIVPVYDACAHPAIGIDITPSRDTHARPAGLPDAGWSLTTASASPV